MIRFPALSIPSAPKLDDILEQDRNSLGVMRVAMALAVLVSHCFFLASGRMEAEPLYGWTGYTLGQHGVQVFFIMSGVLVMQSLMKSESVRDYAIARALRIFPALLVCVLLTALVLGPLMTSLPVAQYLSDPATPRYIVRTALLITGMAPLPGVFSDNAAPALINSSLWTLKYEVLCYVLLAGLGAIAIATKRYKEIFLGALALALPLIFYKRPELAKTNGLLENIRYFALFFGTGVVAYVARHRLALTWIALPPLFAVFALTVGTYFAELTMALFLGYAALWLASFRFGPLRSFTNHQDYSYGVYIYGVPVTQALLHFHPTLDVLSLVLISIAFVLPLAHLSWQWIERPALGLRHALRAKVAATAASTAPCLQASGALRSMVPAQPPLAHDRRMNLGRATPVAAIEPEHVVARVPIKRIAQAARVPPAALAIRLDLPLRPVAPAKPEPTVEQFPEISAVVVPLRPRMVLTRPIHVPC